MTDTLTAEIFSTANQYDVPLPAAVLEAETLLTAARALRDKVAAETEPDLAGLTAKTLTRAHESVMAWENRGPRLAAADRLVKHAADVLSNTMFTSALSLWEPLAGLFERAGEDFTAAYADLGGTVDVANIALDPVRADAYARLSRSADDLDQLSNARDAFAPRGNRADTVSDLFEKVSRCLVVPVWAGLARSPLRGRGIPYWAEAVKRGYPIRWQSRVEQEENSRVAVLAGRASTAYTASASA